MMKLPLVSDPPHFYYWKDELTLYFAQSKVKTTRRPGINKSYLYLIEIGSSIYVPDYRLHKYTKKKEKDI